MSNGSYRPGEVIVPSADRARFRHPLRGTALALAGRRSLRWMQATRRARRHNARLSADAHRLNFTPGRPQPAASIWAILERLGIRIGFDMRAGEPTMAWDAGSWFPERAARLLPLGTINGGCLDVSKSSIDRRWSAMAGYSVSVDPLTTAGPIVVKSDLNGTHDGRLVNGPLAQREAGLVYQRLIDGRREGRIHATRAVIIGEAVPLAFEKWRPEPNWFDGGDQVEPLDPASLYAKDELALIMRFVKAIGLDYGEVDVLRENDSGRIYVIDVNRTPIRPIGLAAEHDERVYRSMADSFATLLSSRLA